MTNIKNCPACQAENPSDATVCTHCGASLIALAPVNTTVRVPDSAPKAPLPKNIVELTQLYADALVFQVLGHDQPVLVKGGGKVLIGRFTPGETPPSIDLNPYNGAILGVSRMHAQILRVDNVYTIQDLGSTNGTWLNETRLPANQQFPLNSGDLLRMGQLGAYVYFQTENTSQHTEETLFLKYKTEGANAFDWTARSWSQMLMPYITGLSDLQAICDQLHSRQPNAVIIHNIMHDTELGVIKMVISGASDALVQLKAGIIRWNQREPVPAHPSTNGSAPSSVEEVPPIEGLMQFSAKVVADLSPALAEAEQKVIAERLGMVLRGLIDQPLELT